MIQPFNPIRFVFEAILDMPREGKGLFGASLFLFLALVVLRLAPSILLATLVAQVLSNDSFWYVTGLLYAGLFLARRVFEEARFACYVLFEQLIQKELALKVLQVFYRLRFTEASAKNASELAIITDRGLGGIRAVLFNGMFSIAPLLMEVLLIAVILGFQVSWPIALLVAGLLTVFMVVTYYVSEEVQKRQQAWFATATKNYGVLTENLRSFEALRAFNAESWAKGRYAKAMDKFVGQVRWSVWPNLWLGLWQGILLFVIMGVTSLLVWQRGTGPNTVEALVLVNGLLLQVSAPLLQFSTAYRTFVQGLSSARELLSLLALPQGPAKISFEKSDATDLSIRDLRVHAGTRKVLDVPSLTIPLSGFTVVAGASGSGKSLFAKTLAGLRELDGHIASPIATDDIYLINQAVELFDLTLAENITLGASEEPERITKTLQRAGFLDAEIENIADRNLGESGRLVSGGQRKRIGIARLLYHDAKLVILDEPTSELDEDTASHVADTLSEIATDIPVIAVSHDAQVIARADRVYRVQDGRVYLERDGSAQGTGRFNIAH